MIAIRKGAYVLGHKLKGKPVQCRRGPATVSESNLQYATEATLREGAERDDHKPGDLPL